MLSLAEKGAWMQEATAHYVARIRRNRAEEERRRNIEASMTQAREIAKRIPPGPDTTDLIRRDRDSDYGKNVGDG